jgi:hypothetical protein
MKITEIITETTAGASSSGGFATVEQELFDQRRAPAAPAKKKKSGKKYVNSLGESAAGAVFNDSKIAYTHGLSATDLHVLSESSGDDFTKFQTTVVKNLNLPKWTNTLELWGYYVRSLNEGRLQKSKIFENKHRESELENKLFQSFQSRCKQCVTTAGVGDTVSLLHLSVLHIPDFKTVATLSGFIHPKTISKIIDRGAYKQLVFSDGDTYPKNDSGQTFTMAQSKNMTKLFANSNDASKAYMFYALKGNDLNKDFQFTDQVDKQQQLEEDDLIVIPGQGRARSGFIPHDADRTDHEVEMARSDLQQAAKNASQVLSMIGEISEEQGLEGWVQEKIIKASDYLNTVREYLEGKYGQEEGGYGMTPQCGCEAPCDCAKLAEKGLWDNIHKKRMRIKHGSGERMRKPGSAGAPTAANFKAAQAGSTNEAAAKNNPYAIGMAAAKSSAGYSKKPAHDLPKSVITKGHEIAKSIKKKGR